jgi:hypothetical protein
LIVTVPLEGVLDRDRLRLPLRLHRPVVPGVRQLDEGDGVVAADHLRELVHRHRLEVADEVDADPVQLVRRDGADARDDVHPHRPQQLDLAAGGHDPAAVRLRQLAGHLGHELGRRHADRGGEATRRGADRGAQVVDHLLQAHRVEGRHAVGRPEVDERLVQGQRLDQRRQRPQPGHHQRTGLPVRPEPARQEGGVGAAPARLVRRHRRAHPEHPGLVRRGRHDAPLAHAPDHDRLAPQRRLVALLDRREERVEVEVQHRRLGSHEAILRGRR